MTFAAALVTAVMFDVFVKAGMGGLVYLAVILGAFFLAASLILLGAFLLEDVVLEVAFLAALLGVVLVRNTLLLVVNEIFGITNDLPGRILDGWFGKTGVLAATPATAGLLIAASETAALVGASLEFVYCQLKERYT